MQQTIKILLLLLVFVTPQWQCKQNYVSPYKSPPTGYLVVEGYITGNGPTQFTLTRSIALPGDSALPVERNAKLQVEGDDNSLYPLTEQGNGIYGTDALPLSTSVKYRLHISTSGGRQYLSDYVPYKPTPAIDSVNWTIDPNQLKIYANTHDPVGNTRYYQWEYVETWEYHSAEYSSYKYLPLSNTVVPRTDSEQIYRCWHQVASSAINIGTSTKLSEDVIYLQPLVTIPTNSYKVSVLYTIQVRQYALTEDGYNFLSLMQKNTESLGSIFDVQPSELKGNIHSLADPNEVVVGFVSAGTVQEQRIYISRAQVPGWKYFFSCSATDSFILNNPDTLRYYFTGGFIPLYLAQNMAGQSGYESNFTSCIDCTMLGGNTKKPAFWPN